MIVSLIFAGGIIAKTIEPSNQVAVKTVGSVGSVLSWPNSQFNFFSGRQTLVQSNQKLKDDIRSLNAQLLSSKMRIEELEVMVQEFGRAPMSNVAKGKIILRSGYFSFDTFWLGLDKSATTSIRAGNLVISDHNILLGEVVVVYDSVAKAKLYSAPSRKTAVRIGAKNIPTMATGLGGGNYLVTLPTSSEVVHNDLVRTEKNGQEYILGIVGTVEKNAETPFQKVYIKPPVNIYELRYAGIIFS